MLSGLDTDLIDAGTMSRIVAIANQKGGVGKTTTAINVSASVAAAEQSALVVDLDPQANLTSGLGIDTGTLNGNTIYRGLIEGAPIEELVLDTELERLKLVPSERNLTGAEIELVDEPVASSVCVTRWLR